MTAPVCTVYAGSSAPNWECNHDQTSGTFARLSLVEQVEACSTWGQCFCDDHDPLD